MVDQKVNEGIKVDLFKKKALTINIPAQLALKHGYSLVPIEIKRVSNANFVIQIKENIKINLKMINLVLQKKLT